jgi:hypothetical protein
MRDWQAKMDPSIRDWLVIGCSMASVCASLSAPLIGNFLGGLRSSKENSRALRKETYAAILDQIARAAERFLSASVRLNLLRLRPQDSEIATHINEDLSAGWLALEDLGKMLAADQLICSDKVLALVSEAKSTQFWNAESLFRLYGYSALDINDLHKHTQDLFTKLRHRCRREVGLR